MKGESISGETSFQLFALSSKILSKNIVDNCYRKKSIAIYTNHFLFTGGDTTEDLEMTVVLVCFVLQLYFVMLIISQCVSKMNFWL